MSTNNEKPSLSKNEEEIIEYAKTGSSDVWETGNVVYMPRSLIQVSLPHSDPKAGIYERTNGNFTLRITDTTGNGLPFGSYARLLLVWLTTEAKRTNSRKIKIGNNVSEFMRNLGMATDGRTRRILKNHVTKILGAAFTFSRDSSELQAASLMLIAEEYEVWWNRNQVNGSDDSSVVLSEKFFKEIVEHAVPVDLRALILLKRSPMAMDLYIWLTQRMNSVYARTEISWKALQPQIGSSYSRDIKGRSRFQESFKEKFIKVKLIYPQANAKIVPGRIILSPSETHVPKRYPQKTVDT